MVSNPSEGAKKLLKAGHSQWLGRRPTIQEVTMNLVHRPHYEGEGRSKSSGTWGFSNPLDPSKAEGII